MALQRFRETRFRPETRDLIDTIVSIVEEYGGQKLTCRQVYYQLIGRDVLPDSWIDEAYNRKNGLPADTKNTEKNYKKVTNLLTDARYAGLLDWEVIEDRGRVPMTPAEWPSVHDAVEENLYAFRLPRWADQPKHVLVMVEKQALEGVLWPICSRWHVPLLVNKGYSSASAVKDLADILIQKADDGKEVVVLYVGDHDPSGKDMPRDIKSRLTEFGVDLTVEPVALTISQVKQMKLPPNPAKITDSRAKAYIEQFGNKSWEVDAINPKLFNKIVDMAISDHCDIDLYEAVKREEKEMREKAKKAMEKIR